MFTDDDYMRIALNEARKGEGSTWPNPMVGAIIVEDGIVVARGYHARAGSAHAEIMALSELGRPPGNQAVLYVTLEPCSTQGRTGPCTDMIVASGIRDVVVGAIDPNPRHQGRGLEILRQSGLKVRSGVLRAECEQLNLEFNQRMAQQ